MTRARVLLADDHALIAQSLARFLRDDFDLVATVADGQALVDSARRLRPDVIVADVSMPVMTGLEALQQLRRDGIDARVVLLTAHRDVQLAAEAVRAGAEGFLIKHMAGEELVAAIHEVLQGRIYLSPLLSKNTPRRAEGRIT